MITVKLDTPLIRGTETIRELTMETPILARHLLKATREATKERDFSQVFCESLFSLEPGELENLTLEDYAKVQEVIMPFMASFQRFKGSLKP